MPELIEPLKITPQYRDYVWGGYRLRKGELTAEAWLIYKENMIESGKARGMTLYEAVINYRDALLGSKVVQKTGLEFPLLIKILDCNQWLSLQVHPDDRLARQLEGESAHGKTEAWYIIDAAEGATIRAGVCPGVSVDALMKSLGSKDLLSHVQLIDVKAGDVIYMPARTIHALGPGLLVYEIQQSSDITYRVYDWDRPKTSGRALHLGQARKVIDPEAACWKKSGLEKEEEVLVAAPYFSLERLSLAGEKVMRNTNRESFHAVTVLFGRIRVQTGGGEAILHKYQSLIVPADAEVFALTPETSSLVLIAHCGDTLGAGLD